MHTLFNLNVSIFKSSVTQILLLHKSNRLNSVNDQFQLLSNWLVLLGMKINWLGSLSKQL